jgi:4-phytase/acid phosphatase
MQRAACAVAVLMMIAGAAGAAPTELALVVMLSRHGVRPPLGSMNNGPNDQARYAAQPWPKWPVPAGDLTPHGARLATLLGRYYAARYIEAAHLLPPEPQAARQGVYVHADNDERCIKTAQALLDGFLPGAGIAVDALPAAAADPLFHPIKAGVCGLDAAQRRAAVLGRIGADPDALTAAYAEPLGAAQRALQCCAPSACAVQGRRCTLLDVPAQVQDDGQVTGPMLIGQTAAENFLLETAEGMPAARVGWGRVTRAALLDMLRVHTAYFDLVFRNPVRARAEASNVAAHILASMEQTVTGVAVAGLAPPPSTRFVAYVAHDVDIAKLGGLLNLTWLTPGFQPNQTPPTGALVFELHRRRRAGGYLVRAFFVSQTLEQMAAAAPLTPAAPPSVAPILIPGCGNQPPGFDCEYEGFKRVVRAAVDPACVEKTLVW